MSLLNNLTPIKTKSRKRVGRGFGSGKGGHTVGRGTKGQNSRTGGGVPIWFEGGHLPLIKRLPMLRGKGRLSNLGRTVELRLDDLNRVRAKVVTLDTLKLEKILDPTAGQVKIVASGELDKALTIKGLAMSKNAEHKLKKAGGSFEVTPKETQA